MAGASASQPTLKGLAQGRPLILTGDAKFRGKHQSTADLPLGPSVVKAVMGRVLSADESISQAGDYLAAQWDFMDTRAPHHLKQITGIAEGYGIKARDLFAYLHLGLIEDAEGGPRVEEDGCSVIASQTVDAGPVLAKNRDYRGEHRALQRVFLESDPAWGDRQILSVGSLGSPGAFSSGINSDGLALADTRIGWRQPGVGWLRYLLMNEILIRAATVAEAITFIESQPHAGGGSLVLMDAAGDAATIELGTGRVHVAHAAGNSIGRTNHFLDPDLFAGQSRSPDDAKVLNSQARLRVIEGWIEEMHSESPALKQVVGLMASHRGDGGPALCCHGKADGADTISTSVFACASRMLYFCPGNPCTDDWQVYAF